MFSLCKNLYGNAALWIALIVIVIWLPLSIYSEYLRDCDVSVNNERWGDLGGKFIRSAGIKQATQAYQFHFKTDYLRQEIDDVGLNVLR